MSYCVHRSCLMFVFAVILASRVAAQDPFGGQSRADAAGRMLVLGVQQGISSLPPTSGQSFTVRFDPELASLVQEPDGNLEPQSFRSTQVIDQGTLSIRTAFSYLDLDDSFGPIAYEGRATDPNDPTGIGVGYAEFGTNIESDVYLFNFAVSYGVIDRLELSLNVPVVIIDVKASQTFTTREETLGVPVSMARVAAANSLEALEAFKELGRDPSTPNDGIVLRSEPYKALGFDFNRGTNVGVGRTSLGAKFFIYGNDYAEAAFSTEVFFPSPHEDEYAGSESFAILPRLIGRVAPIEMLRFHTDVGYDYDFEESDLTRFVWNAGASLAPYHLLVFDAGFGGSLFDTPIHWSPQVANAPGDPGAGIPPLTITALTDTSIGDDFVDFLAGAKFKLSDMVVIGGTLTVPINSQGFRADAVGTFSAEVYF